MRTRRAFTLIELLIVLGIIVVLAALMVPAFASARRQARAVRCLAALNQIGSGFMMYSQEYNGMFPVAVHEPPGSAEIPINVDRRWYDLIAKFITSENMRSIADLEKVRKNSVLWGCPDWSRVDEYVTAGDRYRPGYGMNYYNTFVEGRSDFSRMAYISGATPGRYIRQVLWTNPNQRGLLVDSITHVVNTPITFNSRTGMWFPYDPIQPGPSGSFYVDAARHARPGLSKQESYTRKSVNMLFCDGHAEIVSVREAWNAINNPGQDLAGP